MLKIAFRIFSILLLSTFAAETVFAGLAGTFDTSFGSGGKVFTAFEGQNSHYTGNRIKRQADGKIVMACAVSEGGCLVRYNADGSLDASFANGGELVANLPGFQDIAIQPDGKIVVVGVIWEGSYPNISSKGLVIRYSSNGTLDLSFDSDGIKSIDSIGTNNLSAVAIQPDGKIVAAGYASVDGNQGGLMVTRLNSDGTLDTSFSGDGFAGRELYGSLVDAVVLQPDGKILTSGTFSTLGSGSMWVMTRHNADGSDDTSFDGDGVVFTAWPNMERIGSSFPLVLQPDGKILVAGRMQPAFGASYNIAIVRYRTDGSLDISFDDDGKVIRHVSAADRDDMGADLALQPDGKILVLANVNAIPRSTPTEALLGLLRLNTDGSPDGVTMVHVDSREDYSSSMLLQPNGKLLVAGVSLGNFVDPDKFYLLRFNTNVQAPFDFDGDGKTDISIYRPAAGEWWISRSSGGTFAAPFGGSNVRITPADFTRGGKMDIAFWQPSNGEWFVWRSEEDSYYSFPFGLNGDIPTVGDFDGDGKADAAIFRPSNARWYVKRSTDGVATLQVFGANGDIPVPADYDGDGKVDIAIYRLSNGQWWIQKSTGGTIAYQFGNSSDKPVPGDYTGDGKADVAFWRPSTGEWCILRSENNSFYSYPFGVSTDMASPGDYDGDGKYDAAVFRPSTSRWYIQRSTAGTLIQTFGQSGDIPVPSAFVP